MNHEFAWDELELLWNANNFGAVHDWLGERWNHLIQSRPDGHEDPDARFLQGLAFAALAFHFTQNQNQDGAALLADDALTLLPQFVPAYRGVALGPVLETLNTLRPLLAGPEHEAVSLLPPCVLREFGYRKGE